MRHCCSDALQQPFKCFGFDVQVRCNMRSDIPVLAFKCFCNRCSSGFVLAFRCAAICVQVFCFSVQMPCNGRSNAPVLAFKCFCNECSSVPVMAFKCAAKSVQVFCILVQINHIFVQVFRNWCSYTTGIRILNLTSKAMMLSSAWCSPIFPDVSHAAIPTTRFSATPTRLWPCI